jgi:hypothetical protein
VLTHSPSHHPLPTPLIDLFQITHARAQFMWVTSDGLSLLLVRLCPFAYHVFGYVPPSSSLTVPDHTTCFTQSLLRPTSRPLPLYDPSRDAPKLSSPYPSPPPPCVPHGTGYSVVWHMISLCHCSTAHGPLLGRGRRGGAGRGGE